MQQDFDKLADELDMFIITGGDDSTLRRAIETKLASKIMQRNKPVIGICHAFVRQAVTVYSSVSAKTNATANDNFALNHFDCFDENSK